MELKRHAIFFANTSPTILLPAIPQEITDGVVRVRAPLALASLGTKAVPAIPRLKGIALSKNPHDSIVARYALLLIAPLQPGR